MNRSIKPKGELRFKSRPFRFRSLAAFRGLRGDRREYDGHRLEFHPRAELKFARSARSTTYHSEVAVLDSGIGVSEIQVIDEVERFGSNLQSSLIHNVNRSEE